jgi:hypothetical protein
MSTCVALVFAIGVMPVAAAPLTWEASGSLASRTDPPGFLPPPGLSGIAVGTPWTLDITFDPDAAGAHQAICPASAPTFYYPTAILFTRFQLDGFTYTNTTGAIAVNADLPAVGCQSGLGGPGLVQFVWQGGWVGGGVGGPDLNNGLLLASYNDLQAVLGALPLLGPQVSGVQGAFTGLEWDAVRAQFTSSFTPAAVPEPATGLLVAAGLVALLARRRWSGHRPSNAT